MSKISPYVFWQSFDNNGAVLAGGKVFTYEAGTTTNKETFTSEDEGASNTNPIILDSSGRADIWLGSGSYKFVITDSSDVTISTVDDITAGTSDVYSSGVSAVSVNTPIVESFRNLIVDCTNTITLSLLDVATADEGFIFVVKNSGTGVITLDADGSELIDGAATKTIQAGGSLNVTCTGTAWITTNENYGTTNAETMTFTGNNTHTGTNSYSGVSTHTALVIWSKGADVASATALPVLTDGNYFDVTGTAEITSIGTLGVGTVIKLHFDAALNLANDATNLILLGGVDITTAAGDEAELIEYATGDWRMTNYSRASGEALISPFSGSLLHIQDQKTNGTDGGTFTSGSFQTRVLNTVVTNEITGASLSSNQITLATGTYYIEATAPAHSGGSSSINQHKAKLRNTSDSTDALIGTSERSVGANVQTRSFVSGRFTIASSKTFELQHRCIDTQSTNGFGIASSFSVIEVYSDVKIWKVG